MKFINYLDELWIPKYECIEGILVVGAASKVVPVSFAVSTDLIKTRNRLYIINSTLFNPIITESLPNVDAWTDGCFAAAVTLSDEIVGWLKQEIMIHSKSYAGLN